MIGFNTMLNYKANYKQNRDSWDNDIDLAYGFVNNQGQGVRKTILRTAKLLTVASFFTLPSPLSTNPPWSAESRKCAR